MRTLCTLVLASKFATSLPSPLHSKTHDDCSQPPFTTPAQQHARDAIAMAAVGASTFATATVLARLNDSEFRQRLQEVAPPAVSSASSDDLLADLRASLDVAEFVHGFPSSLLEPSAYMPAVAVGVLEYLRYLPSMWELVAGRLSALETRAYWSLLMYLGPCAVTEVEGWGLPPFTGDLPVPGPILGHPSEAPWPGDYPANFSEASGRAVYTVMNVHRVDLPAELYGDVSLVLNRSAAINSAAVLSPMDSGDWSLACDPSNWTSSFCALWASNASACNEFWYCALDHSLDNGRGLCARNDDALSGRNCSSIGDAGNGSNSNGAPSLEGALQPPPRGLGVPGAIDHLFLPYADYYGSSGGTQHARLAALAARALTPWGGLRSSSGSNGSVNDDDNDDTGAALPFPVHNVSLAEVGFFYYMEANLLASPPLPSSATYVLAAFPKLFGSLEGEWVAQWAAAKVLPLAWGLGASLNRGVAFPPDLNFSWAANSRMWDPRSATLLRTKFNLSVVPTDVRLETSPSDAPAEAFEAAWEAVKRERARARAKAIKTRATTRTRAHDNHHSSPEKSTVGAFDVVEVEWSPADFARWWSTALDAAGPGYAFEPLLPGRCARGPSQCVGLSLNDGDCICAR